MYTTIQSFGSKSELIKREIPDHGQITRKGYYIGKLINVIFLKKKGQTTGLCRRALNKFLEKI